MRLKETGRKNLVPKNRETGGSTVLSSLTGPTWAPHVRNEQRQVDLVKCDRGPFNSCRAMLPSRAVGLKSGRRLSP